MESYDDLSKWSPVLNEESGKIQDNHRNLITK